MKSILMFFLAVIIHVNLMSQCPVDTLVQGGETVCDTTTYTVYADMGGCVCFEVDSGASAGTYEFYYPCDSTMVNSGSISGPGQYIFCGPALEEGDSVAVQITAVGCYEISTCDPEVLPIDSTIHKPEYGNATDPEEYTIYNTIGQLIYRGYGLPNLRGLFIVNGEMIYLTSRR